MDIIQTTKYWLNFYCFLTFCTRYNEFSLLLRLLKQLITSHSQCITVFVFRWTKRCAEMSECSRSALTLKHELKVSGFFLLASVRFNFVIHTWRTTKIMSLWGGTHNNNVRLLVMDYKVLWGFFCASSVLFLIVIVPLHTTTSFLSCFYFFFPRMDYGVKTHSRVKSVLLSFEILCTIISVILLFDFLCFIFN